MNLATSQQVALPAESKPSAAKWRSRLRLQDSWEIYLIVLIAGFLRLYRIDTTVFNIDQANLFRMVYDAVHHGMLVATSNSSSIGTINPPAIIYLLMPTALFSANPMWAAVWLALLTTVGVLITYFFVRRYFGRVAGTIAGLLFATVNTAVYYSRFIWNPTLLLFFVPLFIAVLLWGVVEKRKGWFFPAAFLLGLMYQFHASSLLLVAALVVAVVLVPRTIRWRDLMFAALSLIVLFFPYLLWLRYSNFRDIGIMISTSRLPVQIDTQALGFYQTFLGASQSAALPIPADYPYVPIANAMNAVMSVLLVLAGGMAVVQVILPGHRGTPASASEQVSARWWGRVWSWWLQLRANPYRSSLLILLTWQVVPLLVLLRHSLPEYQHYLFFVVPGQYILIALLLARAIECFRNRPWGQFKSRGQLGRSASIAIGLLSVALIVTQFGVSLWPIAAVAAGNFSGGGHQWSEYYTLNSLKNAIHEADQLAQQRHLRHLYIEEYANFDYLTNAAYLAEHTITPATVFGEKCLILPDQTAGPAALLVGPYNDVTDAVLSHYASATLIDEPRFLGEAPFKLYIVQTLSTKASAQAQNTLPNGMQLLGTQRVNVSHTPWLATRWNILRADSTRYQTTYAYKMINRTVPPDSTPDDQIRECFYTSIQVGDQFISTFPLSSSSQAPTSLNIQVQSYKIIPIEMEYTLFNRFKVTFATGAMDFQVPVALLTNDKLDHVTIPVPK